MKVVEILIQPKAKAVPLTHNITYRMCPTPIPTLFTIAYSSFNGLKQYVPTTCLSFSISGRTLGVIPLLEAKYASVTYWHVFMDSVTSTSPSVI